MGPKNVGAKNRLDQGKISCIIVQIPLSLFARGLKLIFFFSGHERAPSPKASELYRMFHGGRAFMGRHGVPRRRPPH